MAAILASVVPVWSHFAIINYYSVPLLFTAIYFYILVVILEAGEYRFLCFMLGILNSLLIFSKTSSIGILLLPCFLYLIYSIYHQQYKINWEMVLYWFLGFVIVTLIFVVWYKSIGLYDMPKAVNFSQDSSRFHAIYREYVCNIPVIALSGFIAYMMFNYAAIMSNDKVLRWLFLILLPWGAYTLFAIGLKWEKIFDKYIFMLIYVLGGLAYTLVFMVLSKDYAVIVEKMFPEDTQRVNFKCIIWCILAIAMLVPLGSYVAFWATYCVMPLVAAFLFVFLFKIFENSRNNIWVWGIMLGYITIGLFGNVLINIGNPINVLKLERFTTPQLSCNFTTNKGIGKFYDENILKLKNYVKDGDSIFEYNNFAMLTPMLGARPVFGTYLISLEAIKKYYDQNIIPKHVIIGINSATNEKDSAILEWLRRIIEEKFILNFENEYFKLYSRSD